MPENAREDRMTRAESAAVERKVLFRPLDVTLLASGRRLTERLEETKEAAQDVIVGRRPFDETLAAGLRGLGAILDEAVGAVEEDKERERTDDDRLREALEARLGEEGPRRFTPARSDEYVVRGKVLDESGKPMAGLVVEARPEGGRGPVGIDVTDAGGKYEIKVRGARFGDAEEGPEVEVSVGIDRGLPVHTVGERVALALGTYREMDIALGEEPAAAVAIVTEQPQEGIARRLDGLEQRQVLHEFQRRYVKLLSSELSRALELGADKLTAPELTPVEAEAPAAETPTPLADDEDDAGPSRGTPS